jgi:hypothetical protein
MLCKPGAAIAPRPPTSSAADGVPRLAPTRAFEGEAAQRGLDDERDQAHASVIGREETQQPVAVAQ